MDCEIKAYIKEELVERSLNPLLYWKSKEECFPSLAAMAKQYLSVPTTSTPAERVFSKGRLLINHVRNRLNDNKIQAVLCLNNWLKNKIVQ